VFESVRLLAINQRQYWHCCQQTVLLGQYKPLHQLQLLLLVSCSSWTGLCELGGNNLMAGKCSLRVAFE
jgi:hypothetical protein